MLKIQLFGPPMVWRDGQRIEALARWPIPLEIVAYLALHRDRPHRRSQLVALFWPDLDEMRARQYLNTHLSRLRQVLDQPGLTAVIHSDRERVRLNPDLALWLDVEEFEQLQAEINIGTPPNRDQALQHLPRLAQAVHLVQGELLEGVDADWCRPWRAQLQAQFVALLDQLITVYRLLDRPHQALQTAQRLATLEPLHEEAHAQVITLLNYLERPTEAYAHFRRYATLWRDELGLDPSPHLIALLQPGLCTADQLPSDRDAVQREQTAVITLSQTTMTAAEAEVLSERASRLGDALRQQRETAQAEVCYEIAIDALTRLPATPDRAARELEARRACDPLYDLSAQRNKQTLNLNAMQGLADQTGRAEDATDVLARRCWLAIRIGDTANALTHGDALLKSAGSPRDQALAQRLVGIAHDRADNFDQAYRLHQEALRLDEALGDEVGIYNDLNNLGNIRNYQGQHALAIPLLQRARGMDATQIPLSSQAAVHGNLGHAFTRLGQLTQASDFLREAMSLAWQAGDRDVECWIGSRLAILLCLSGDGQRALTTAHHHYTQALDIDLAWEVARLANTLVFIHLHQSDGAAALTWADRAGAISAQHGCWRLHLLSHIRRARALLALAQPHAGLEAAQVALALLDERGQPSEDALELLTTLAECARATGAFSLHKQAVARFRHVFRAALDTISTDAWTQSFMRLWPLARSAIG